MKHIIFIITLIYLTVSTTSYSQIGTTGLSFLKNGVGAKSLAMGEISITTSTDPTNAFFNPALIAQNKNVQLHSTHKTWMKDIKTDYIAAIATWKSFNFGFSINSTSVEDIEIRTIPGDPEGYFTARNVAIGLTSAYKINNNLNIGITGKYIYEKIYVDEASGLALDIGGSYLFPLNSEISFSINNIGSMSALKDESSKLPLTVRFGAGYHHPFESAGINIGLSADIVSFPQEKTLHLHAGTEITIKNVIAMRGGFVTGYEARTFSAGIGINYGILTFDYAFIPFNYDFSSSHTISLGITI